MKKLLSVLVLSAMFLLPMNAKAAGGAISGGCDPSERRECNGGKCIATCYVVADENLKNQNLKEADITITPVESGIKMGTVEGKNGWLATQNGNQVKLLGGYNANTTDYTLMTFTLELDSQVQDCHFNIAFNGEKEITVPVNPVDPPKTGAALPIAIVAVGAVAAGGIYLVTRKNKKLYKI